MFFTDEQHEKLEQLSDQTGVPVAELVRRAVDLTYGEGQMRWDQFFAAYARNTKGKVRK
jgi:predicted DNA-binding protein